MDTAHLTDEERIYIDSKIVETVRPKLVGRRLFPVFTLPQGVVKPSNQIVAYGDPLLVEMEIGANATAAQMVA